MLQTRIRAALEKRARGDKGFTLIELLVVVIIIGILAAVAIPVFLNQRQKAFDAGVQSDLRNLATAAETTFVENLSYPVSNLTFASNGVAPIVTVGNTFLVYVASVTTGHVDAGYVIFGKAEGSPTVWVISSYNGGAPIRTTRPKLAYGGPQYFVPVSLNLPAGTSYANIWIR